VRAQTSRNPFTGQMQSMGLERRAGVRRVLSLGGIR
jgi:hypothetical protein